MSILDSPIDVIVAAIPQALGSILRIESIFFI
jgi:hypothetical protein